MERFIIEEKTVLPIHPLHIEVRPPCPHDEAGRYVVFIHGEELWKWKLANDSFDTFQSSIEQLGYSLRNDARKRIERLIRVKVHRLKSEISRSKNGTWRQKKLDKWIEFEIYRSEILNRPVDIIHQYEETLCEIHRELGITREKLDSVSSALFEEMALAAELKARVNLLEKDSRMEHSGRPFHDVGERQQKRQLYQISERAKQALWFAETFGLSPQSIQFKAGNGDIVESPLNQNEQDEDMEEPQQPDLPRYSRASYHCLPENEKEKVRTIVYLLDRFSTSLASYHELAQLCPQLARTYHIEACMKSLDSLWTSKLTATPGDNPGAQVPFEEVLTQEIRKEIERRGPPEQEQQDTVIKVKISGDGAAMSRTSSMFVCSLAILNNGQDDQLKSTGNHTVAVVKCKEDYSSLMTSLGNVTSSVNKLIEKGEIIVDGRRIVLDFYLGGDYKFLLIAMGMQAANSTHSCIWCLVSAKDRDDMNKPYNFFESSEMKRKLDTNWYKQPGCRDMPLFDIPLERVIIDELHMFLRIMDRLEYGLVMNAIEKDEKANLGKPPSQKSDVNLKALLTAIQSCGISFNVWKDKANKYDWTSLMGEDKKKLLRELPLKFEAFLSGNECNSTRSLWKDFEALYATFSNINPSEREISSFADKAKHWAKRLLSMKGAGYSQVQPITPYIHILVYHLQALLNIHGSIKQFSGQGVEKKNDDFRRFFHRKINRWDACRSLLLVEKRQEALHKYKRNPRNYQKKDSLFWFEGGKRDAIKQYRKTSAAPPAPTLQLLPTHTNIVTTWTEEDLKKKKVGELKVILEGLLGHQISSKPLKKSLITDILSASGKV